MSMIYQLAKQDCINDMKLFGPNPLNEFIENMRYILFKHMIHFSVYELDKPKS